MMSVVYIIIIIIIEERRRVKKKEAGRKRERKKKKKRIIIIKYKKDKIMINYFIYFLLFYNIKSVLGSKKFSLLLPHYRARVAFTESTPLEALFNHEHYVRIVPEPT